MESHGIFYVPINIGFMSSSQLTNSYFSEGWPNHQPGCSFLSKYGVSILRTCTSIVRISGQFMEIPPTPPFLECSVPHPWNAPREGCLFRRFGFLPMLDRNHMEPLSFPIYMMVVDGDFPPPCNILRRYWSIAEDLNYTAFVIIITKSSLYNILIYYITLSANLAAICYHYITIILDIILQQD